MANVTLSDRESTINSCYCNSSFSTSDWFDHIEDYLAKSQALLRIGMHHALDGSSLADRFYFCTVIDELLEEVKMGCDQVQTMIKAE
jgi:hypothetical protein